MSAATVSDTKNAIDTALRAKGGYFSEYSCKYVSWDDVARGTVGGSLSSLGANITDTYLKSKAGDSLFTVRPDNWNEKLGVVSADDVTILVGNCEGDGSGPLRNVALKEFLEKPAEVAGKYSGLGDDVVLSDTTNDRKVSIRFQTVFLPVSEQDEESLAARRQTFQFAAEAYNYNTRSDDDPRNLIVLATSQGTALQADGKGAKRLLHHGIDSEGTVMTYWLEAERSDHGVGGEQVESEAEREDAIARNKATSETIGIKAMGSRFNCLMTIQVPLQQQKQQWSRNDYTSLFGYDVPENAVASVGCGLSFPSPAAACCYSFGASTEALSAPFPSSFLEMRTMCAVEGKSLRQQKGVSNAARVSRGDEYGRYSGLSVKNPSRNTHEHVTVTVVFYNTVAGGVPHEDDVVAAVNDMEQLYAACSESGRLGDSNLDFMKNELTVNDLKAIVTKVVTQPPSVTNKPDNNAQQ